MKRPLIFVLISLIIAAGCGKKPAQQSKDLYADGLKYLDNFEYGRADSAFAQASKLDSTSTLGSYGQGLVLERQLELFDALNVYLLIADKQPNSAEAIGGAERMYTWLGDPLEVIPLATQSVKISPKDPVVRYRLAQALINARQMESVASVLDSAVKSGLDKGTADLVRARLSLKAGRPDIAEQMAGAALATPGNSSEYWLAAADYLEDRGLTDSAISASRKSIMPGADNFNQQITHFYRCLRAKYFFEARGIIEGFRAKEKSGILTRALDELCADESGRIRTADVAGNEYVQMTKGSISGLFYDARTRYLLLDHNSAFYELQDINIITQKMDASQEFRDYMTYRTALMFARLSDKVAASSRLQSISGWRANRREVKIAVAENRYVTGQFDAFNALRDSILQYRGDRPDWLTDLGMVCISPAIRLYADAEKQFQQALKIDSTYVPAFEGYVSLFAVQKQFDKALALCDRYPFFANFYPHEAITRAIYLVYTNRVADARQVFESRIPSVKGDLTEFDRFLSALDAMNATEDYRATIELMIRLNPDNSDALARAASIALDARNFQDGLSLIDRGLTGEPSFGLLKAMRAQALYGLGKRDEAFKLFEEILAKDNSDVEACLQFSHILATEKIDSVRAENMAMTAFNYEHSLRTQMNACYVYIQFGRYDLARGEALKAIGNFPNSPVPLFYVGLAMSKEGNPEFKKNLEKAVAMGLKGDDLETAKALLKNG